MDWKNAGLRVALTVGATLTLAACSTYPSEPRYSIFADQPPAPVRAPTYPVAAPAVPAPSGEGVLGATDPAREVPPPAIAPVASIEGGSLDSPVSSGPRPYSNSPAPAAGPASEGFAAPPPPARNVVAAVPGAAYEIQPGDTLSGVGRRFQTPVQVLIDLNALGPRAPIAPGQRLILPADAIDIGGDPYATGPSPMGMDTPEIGAPPPPPPPPPPAPVYAAAPPPARQPAATAAPAAAAPAATTVALDWPVRGDLVRRFGPVGMGERNNGVNIGAAAGAEVRASASGRVGYVGDDLAGQGLTILIVHRDGWRTVYGHLGTALVRDGDDVAAGQQIGTVGTTAGDGRPSIHFETWRMRGDEPTAIDPETVLPR
ncbi:murein DD-endopeptidase MepM/ murein hydrolase activator NlpD [Brevundimonas lenta]|uniref:Murein DD-endopeptidase MepM/ murein hydrolase activator NlpD n=1 Tax=Brevundimonas lenta TaxID=424796 RepID=A0A7W6JDF7_9CAUL|nr:M23 family metallopeptidase [Brevundimonas lenta]MBB4083076.1 murein DD-endopeptidase MepM/ murein hydrolase activator NlpD [Brevundimonas lenta]